MRGAIIVNCFPAQPARGRCPTGQAESMPLIAVVLIVIAAFTHATWNILAKGAVGARRFNWYYSAGATTGVLIAVYTLNDAYAAKVLLVSPILIDHVGNLFERSSSRVLSCAIA